MDISYLHNLLLSVPALRDHLDLSTVIGFYELIALLRPILEQLVPSCSTQPPERLTKQLHDFLMVALNLPHEECKLAWLHLRNLAWKFKPSPREELSLRTKYLEVIMRHGLARGIGIYNLYPPLRSCSDCRTSSRHDPTLLRERELVEPVTVAITVFTREFGAVPGFSTSLYCRGCLTRYHPNYFVHNSATQRTYYLEMPSFIQASQHYYISTSVCELFTIMMCSAWYLGIFTSDSASTELWNRTSATNCGHIFNAAIFDAELRSCLPTNWQTVFTLDHKEVWNGFFIYSLLLHHTEHRECLQVPHNAESQTERFKAALIARNLYMEGTGQEAWNHACNDCCWVFQDESDEFVQIRSVVVDGIQIGCPCCSVHDCPVPLKRAKDRFCPGHQALQTRCCVADCVSEAEKGWKTCAHKEHREIEVYAKAQGQAMFQLLQRLRQLRLSQTSNSVDLLKPGSAVNGDEDEGSVEDYGLVDDEEFLHDGENIRVDDHCGGKSASGNVKLRARFGRRRTHCEELCVASCGVILGRATFFGSEAPNGVRNFLMRLFPTKRSLPAVIWHDNNCKLLAMLKNDTDEELRDYFKNCALPVDVFHFKCKHKESDTFCGEHCNPARWPQLRTEDGKWRFNSSAAEQTNVWFGGFSAIVREMRFERYTFFLDEMIKRRNRMVIKELERQGKAPYTIRREILLSTD